jgi:hypothetical protein
MLDGDAIAAPAPKKVAPAASTERAVDKNDRLASARPSTAGELLSILAFIWLTVEAKAKESLSELDESGWRILRL